MIRLPRAHAHPGIFLVLDGPDGGGKTTQAVRLMAWLRDRGHAVVACRDPGGTALGERVRNILVDRDSVPISLRGRCCCSWRAGRSSLRM